MLRDLVKRIFPAAVFGAVFLAAGLAGGPARAVDREACDWPAFERPCLVEGGVYRALAPLAPGPHRTVVYLYGSTGHSRRITEASFFQQIVDRFGYALIVPGAKDILYRGGKPGTGWSLRNGRQKPRDDIAFIRNVLRDAEERFAIDRDNVLFMGQSHGGFLIWEIACHDPELGSAFAVHAGGYAGRMPERCKRPVRFLHTHGTRDKVVPYGGVPNVAGNADMASIDATLAVLERTNGCDPRAGQPMTAGPRNFARYSWSRCDRDGALELMLHRGGHNFPPNWFEVVIDWFERVNAGPSALPLADPGQRGKSIRFQKPGTSRFKSVPQSQ